MSSFFKKLSQAIGPTTEAYMKGADMNSQWKQRAANAAYNQQMAQLAGTKNSAEMLDSGLMTDEKGGVVVDPGFLTPGNPSYERANRAAEIKRLGSTAKVPSTQWEDIYAYTGNERLKGLSGPVDPSVAAKIIESNGMNWPPEVLNAVSEATGIPAHAVGSVAGTNAGRNLLGTVATGVRSNRTADIQVKNQKRLGDQFQQSEDAQANRFTRSETAAEKRHRESLQFQQNKDVESRLEKFRDDYVKTAIGQALPHLRTIEQESKIFSSDTPDLSKFPGKATNAVRGIPIAGDKIAMTMAKSYGGEGVAQAIQGLYNAGLKLTSGQAVSKFEEGRKLLESGLAVGADSPDVARGLRTIFDAFSEEDRAVRGAYSPEVLSLYTQRGGQADLMSEVMKLNPSQKRAAGAKGTAPKASGSDSQALDWYKKESLLPEGTRSKAFQAVGKKLKAKGLIQ